jgi:hypothetical protein
MKINNKFSHGDTVYVVNDVDQRPCTVLSIVVNFGGYLVYNVRTADLEVMEFDEFELAADKDMVLKTSN